MIPNEAERLRLFISSVTDYAIFMLSPEGTVVSWNLGAQRFKGYTATEIIGQHFSTFYTQEDRSVGVPERALATARESGKFEAEGWRVRKDGSRFWASVVIDPVRDENQELIGYTKITRDITDRKTTEQALRESEERFRILVQSVVDYAIFMLSPAGEITNWNAGARNIKGYAESEVVGTHFSRFYTPEDRAAGLPMRALQIAAEQGRFEAEGWRVRKDGSRFWANVVIDAIRNELGELVGFAKVTRDITERKQAEAALEQAREALAQSQKLEAIGQLTGGIAHDFNNLLNVVTNGLFVLRQRIADGESLRLLDAMEQSAARGAKLTDQLLSFARQQPLKQESRDVNRVIGSFEPVLRHAVRSGLRFELNLSPVLPRIKIDTTQFETALLNLVVNARDATADGGRITISTNFQRLKDNEVNVLAAGAYVSVSVQDTGEGMTQEVMARAVEPFFTTKGLGHGTGLGLSQVYGVVQQSGGDIAIQSRPKGGTTMTMYFPAVSDEPDPDSEPKLDPVEKVLVVDDQPEVLETTVEIFRALGFEVLSAKTGEEALDVLRRNPGIQVLFTDVVMPGMNGVDLALQAKAAWPGMNIILASGHAAPAGNLHGFELLTKPYRVGDIAKKLRHVREPGWS